jgi:pimeloyl-ACP methyl ester carboxylesterase
MVAQVFARRHPRRVARLILSTTAVLDEAGAERYRQQLEMMTAAPAEVLAQVSQARFLEMIAPPDSERAFWAAYVEELFTERLSKADQLSTVRCLLDFAHSYRLSSDDLADWGERILLIEADDDATFDAEARSRLRALYPGARTHRFEAGGHSPATTRREEYFALVQSFLKGL